MRPPQPGQTLRRFGLILGVGAVAIILVATLHGVFGKTASFPVPSEATLAGGQLWMTGPRPPGATPMFGPWTSFAILCGYAGVAVAAGVILFRKRDA